MRPATQILVPNNKSAPVNKKNARTLLEDGIFSRFERKLLTEEESKAKAQAPKMEAPLDAFLGRSCVARWEVHRLLLKRCGICFSAWISRALITTNHFGKSS